MKKEYMSANIEDLLYEDISIEANKDKNKESWEKDIPLAAAVCERVINRLADIYLAYIIFDCAKSWDEDSIDDSLFDKLSFLEGFQKIAKIMILTLTYTLMTDFRYPKKEASERVDKILGEYEIYFNEQRLLHGDSRQAMEKKIEQIAPELEKIYNAFKKT